jgi:uncharacterized protein (TIGR00725 family)
VAVVGPSEADTGQAQVAEQVGSLLGQRGAVLVCGGLGGAMEAACRGARSTGGTTVGVLPGIDRRAANPHVDIALATGLGEARNAVVARSADVLIAVGGAYGTLSEIALALRAGTPVVGLGTWGLTRPDGGGADIIGAESAEEAVDLALAAAAR